MSDYGLSAAGSPARSVPSIDFGANRCFAMENVYVVFRCQQPRYDVDTARLNLINFSIIVDLRWGFSRNVDIV